MSELQSPTIGKLAAALVKAQATMGVALKDTTGQIGQNRGYKYADLASVINAARESLTANELAIIQRPQPDERGVCLQTMIVHSSGEWIADGGLSLPAQKMDPQGFGSSMTYARRYGLAAMLGIVQDDDDGAAGVKAMQAARAAADAPKLGIDQLACLEFISAKAGHPGKDRSDLLAEDYPVIVRSLIEYAVKQNVVDAADAPDVEAAALAGDAGQVDTLLKGGVTA